MKKPSQIKKNNRDGFLYLLSYVFPKLNIIDLLKAREGERVADSLLRRISSNCGVRFYQHDILLISEMANICVVLYNVTCPRDDLFLWGLGKKLKPIEGVKTDPSGVHLVFNEKAKNVVHFISCSRSSGGSQRYSIFFY